MSDGQADAPVTAPDAEGRPAAEPVEVPPGAAEAAPGAGEAVPEDPRAAVLEPEVVQPEAAAEPEPEPDWRDRYLRAEAELDNVRKRARRDVGVAQARGIGKLARELLPALDNLERAIAAAEAEEGDAEHHLTRGIRLVQAELQGALTRVGIEADSPEGEAFDPHRHEAVAQQPVEGTAAGVVVQVYQPGYRHGDDVLRAAKVVVSA